MFDPRAARTVAPASDGAVASAGGLAAAGATAWVIRSDPWGDPGVEGQTVGALSAAFLGEGDEVELTAQRDARSLLIAASRTREPAAWAGPFAINMRQEVEQGFAPSEPDGSDGAASSLLGTAG